MGRDSGGPFCESAESETSICLSAHLGPRLSLIDSFFSDAYGYVGAEWRDLPLLHPRNHSYPSSAHGGFVFHVGLSPDDVLCARTPVLTIGRFLCFSFVQHVAFSMDDSRLPPLSTYHGPPD